jgi:decaprenyl-diphosphate synthase subunit 1
VRPCIALCVGQLANYHMGNMEEQGDTARRQKMVAIVSEMIHTASLVHDDILDHAETRRGKESVNVKWDIRRSTICGDFILAVGSRLLSQVGDKEVVVILSQVLADLVQEEFMQLQNKDDESEKLEI